MATRKEIYSMLEGIEGAESAKDALKALFTEDDTKLQEQVNLVKSVKLEVAEAKSLIEDFKAKNENTVPKTEMEKALADIQNTLGVITQERDDIKKANEQATLEKKNGELNSHFSKAVLDSFGSKNTEMAVGFAMSNGTISYGEDNAMGYNGKFGDDAIEAFKADNAHLVQNKGTGTSGGDSAMVGGNAYGDELREIMMRD
jgi:hypothetical protein